MTKKFPDGHACKAVGERKRLIVLIFLYVKITDRTILFEKSIVNCKKKYVRCIVLLRISPTTIQAKLLENQITVNIKNLCDKIAYGTNLLQKSQ